MEKDPHWKRNRIIFYILGLVVVILFALNHYNFFNQRDYKPDINESINLGRDFAYSIFISSPQDELLAVTSGNAKEKYKLLHPNLDWKNKAIKAYKIDSSSEAWAPYLANKSDLELIAWVRDGSYAKIEFAYIDPPISVGTQDFSVMTARLSDKEPMHYFIEMRAELYDDKRAGAIILDKIAHFGPVIFITDLIHIHPYSNKRLHWVIHDFDYNYNLNDYYDSLSSGT